VCGTRFFRWCLSDLQSPALCDAQRFSQPAANKLSCPIRFIYRVITATYHLAAQMFRILMIVLVLIPDYEVNSSSHLPHMTGKQEIEMSPAPSGQFTPNCLPMNGVGLLVSG
jgi:hypothetical protein